MNNQFEKLTDRFANTFEDEFFWSLNINGEEQNYFYSDNVFKVTGYSSEEIHSLPGKYKDLILKEDLPDYRKLIVRFEDDVSKKHTELDYRVKKKDGEIVWIKEGINVSRDENGRITEYVGRVTDISETKSKLNKLNKRIEELEELNSSKDNFISVLSHDLRAPFTSILGFSEILLNESGISEKERTEYLSYINDSSQNQLQMINYLLDWSRLQTGRIKIEPNRIHLQSSVFNCVSHLTRIAVKKNVDTKVNIPDSFYVDADERLLNEVITNLISNAVKYSRENDSVVVTANVFNEDFAEFIVKDEGVGISEANKTKLFKIGTLFSTEGTKGEKGVGLGLTLVKQIVEKHKGEIWFYSEEGKGSEFHFTIPSSANTVLIIIKDETLRNEYEKIIMGKYPSFRILGAANGYEALGLISTYMPSLIITEHDMPLMDGSQFIQTVKRENKNLNIPVIALINLDTEPVKKAYQELGIKTLPIKPVNTELLIERLNSIFS
ncbi:MAG: ATP-binding protein [Ignavibacteriaceae bacterium]